MGKGKEGKRKELRRLTAWMLDSSTLIDGKTFLKRFLQSSASPLIWKGFAFREENSSVRIKTCEVKFVSF